MPFKKTRENFHDEVDGFLAGTEDNLFRTLRYSREWRCFILYRDGHYLKLEKEDFKRQLDPMLRKYIIENKKNISIDDHTLSRYYDYLCTVCPEVKDMTTPYIAFRNQLLNTDTMEFEPFDIKKMAFHWIDEDMTMEDVTKFDFATAPHLVKFLKTTLVDKTGDNTDANLVLLVQQMMGYLLQANLKARVSFFFYGSGHNGKSQICELMRFIIGGKFCSSMTLGQLSERFGTSQLVSKKLNICNEESSAFANSETFKTLISGEAITAERKGQDSFTFIPRTKFLFATNSLPTFKRLGKAMIDRMKIIPFYADFSEGAKQGKLKDINILDKLKTERKQIVCWALQGALHLKKCNYKFHNPAVCRDLLQDYKRENSTALSFMNAWYQPDEFEFVSNNDVWNTYRSWCVDNGHLAKNVVNFFKDVATEKDFVPARKTINDKRVRGFLLKRREDYCFGNLDNQDVVDISDISDIDVNDAQLPLFGQKD